MKSSRQGWGARRRASSNGSWWASPSGDFGLLFNDAAIEEMDRPVGVLGVTGIVGHDANRGPPAMELAEEIHHRFAVRGVEVTGRLVR